MRTTLSLEDELAEKLADLARESKRPFKVVVNETLRRGLGELAPQEPPFVVRPHAGNLRPGIDNRRFNELAWEPEEKMPPRNPPAWEA